MIPALPFCLPAAARWKQEEMLKDVSPTNQKVMTHPMGCEGGDAESKGECNRGWAGIVAKIAGVGGPRGAADK